MKSSFTLNDLILFAYNETKEPEKRKLFKTMQTNQRLKDEFKSIIGIKYCVDSSLISPNKRILSNIMSYSRALSIFKTRRTGNFNLLMN